MAWETPYRRRFAQRAPLAGLALFAAAGLFAWQRSPSRVWAQPPADAAPQRAGTVKLSFPDQIELSLLVDYVSQRLGVKILYDEEVQNKKITVKAPEEVPTASLLAVLESALKIKGLALVDGDVPGWKQIVKAGELSKIAEPSERDLAELENSAAVAQAFRLQHIAPQKLDQIVKPFLTQPGASSIALPEQSTLIVTDYGRNLKRIARLVEAVDQAGPPSEVEIVKVEHLDAQALAQQLRELSAVRGDAPPAAEGAAPLPAGRLEISHDARTNQVILVGPRALIDYALRLAKTFDVPLGTRTEIYSFQYVEAERIDRLVKELFDPLTIERLYRSAIDGDDNLLIVTAPDDVHERVQWFRREMDVESKRPGSSVRFYKLKNATAEEVLSTLQAVQQGGFGGLAGFNDRFSSVGPRGVSPLGRGPTGTSGYSMGQPFRDQYVPGPNYPATPSQINPTLPPAQQVLERAAEGAVAPPPTPAPLPTTLSPDEASAAAFAPDAARVSSDPSTNSIIVVGDRNVQEVYKDLIEYLDKKRPQVMIEARVVIIDTSDDYSLGVEFSAGDRQGSKRLFEFTSYGLSTVNPVNGALAIVPGRGLNWTLVDPDVADAVLKALATHRRARVLSAPRVMVNDNATGTLASVTEVPFTSVNASNTVATTSFAGFAEAGTTIEVTPRISESNHLVLEYVVTLNSFTGAGSAGVPPPRQTDEVRSTVTIPDGHTVVVGGLNRANSSLVQDGIPFLENIPVVRELTSLRTTSQSRTTLFVFLRPVILRDDKFRDLQYLSDKSLACAGCDQNVPQNLPLLVK